jgi:catechol 2,3-dioxygenase-like lactoylglutathione lyase family enzyme
LRRGRLGQRSQMTPDYWSRTRTIHFGWVPEFSVPILPSKNLDATLAFYERLGFENVGAAPSERNYLIIRRGSVQLHFYGDPEVDPLTTSSSCYIFTDDADALYEAWNAIGVPTDAGSGSRLEGPADTDYGMREFALVDPSGNLVRVGSPPFV